MHIAARKIVVWFRYIHYAVLYLIDLNRLQETHG